ncbi:hypothetical protein BJ138DRAFT_1103602, partial [Hygrophoropsis aurantiaca]
MPSPSALASSLRPSSGRDRRKSGKAQAMIDEQQEKESRKHKELAEKARAREERNRKHNQITKAAEKLPLRSHVENYDTSEAPVRNIAPDSSFSSRVVDTLAQGARCSAVALVARKGNVPPAPLNFASPKGQPTTQLTSRTIPGHARILTVEKAAKLANIRAVSATTRAAQEDKIHLSPSPVASYHTNISKATHSFSAQENSLRSSQSPTPQARHPLPHDVPELSDEEFADEPEDEDMDVNEGFDINERHSKKRHPTEYIDHNLDGNDEVDDNGDDNDGEDLDGNDKADNNGNLCEETAASAGRGRPKAGNYVSSVRAVLKLAIEIYHGLLLTRNPFPDDVEEVEWSRLAWKQACANLDLGISHMPELLTL